MEIIPSAINNFYMSPLALNITLNAMGDANMLSVSVYANAKVTVYHKGIIDYNPDNNYRQWTLSAYNTFFENNVARYCHLAISKTGDVATVVYPDHRLDLCGRAINDDCTAFIDSNNDESEDYWFVFIGKISSSASGYREWEVGPYSGNLDTDQYRNEENLGDWAKMFSLNSITDMIVQLKPLTKLILGTAKKIASDIWTSEDEGTPSKPDETLLTYGGFENEADSKYLRKDKDDTAKGHITFEKGLTTDEIKSSNYQAGTGFLDGQGYHMYIDANGQSHEQVDFIDVVKKAVFAELEIRKYTSIGGNLILSGANSTLQSVEPIYDGDNIVAYKCYIKTDDGTMATMNDWQEGMQALCQSFNVREGVYENVENQYYWRVVTEVHQRGGDNDEAYVVLSNKRGYYENGSTAPKSGDAIVQCGFNALYYVNEINPLDTTLSLLPVNLTGVLMLESNALSSGQVQIATSIKSYDLVTDFSFDRATQTAKISRDGVSFNASTFKWSSSIGEIAPLIYVGSWSDWDWDNADKIPYFHEVDYAGYRWVCIATDGVTKDYPPSDDSPYWRMQKAKGITYDAYLEHSSDNITVDADGNVVDGLWEESVYDGNVSKVFKLHTAVFSQKSEDYLMLDYVNYGSWSDIDFEHIDGLPYHSVAQDASGKYWRWEKNTEAKQSDTIGGSGWKEYDLNIGAGYYGIELIPNECTALVKEGMLHIVAISHVKDGISGSSDDDWSDEDFAAMRAMQRCYVDVAVNMEGVQTKLLTFSVNINHIETSVITSQIDNQSGTMSWSATAQKHINTCGAKIYCQYRNEPVDIYYSDDDPSTPSYDERIYNPRVEVKNASGAVVNTINASVSVVTDAISNKKIISLSVSPKTDTTNNIINGDYVARVFFYVRVNGSYYEKVITHDIHKNNQGVTFELRPSNLTIHAKYNDTGSLVTDVNTITCAVDVYDNEGKRETTSADWTTYGLSVKCNGTNVAFGSNVSVSADTKEYVFALYRNGIATNEKQTVYVVADGKVGEDGNDIEYIYARTLNKTVKPKAPRFNAPYDTSKITDTAQDNNNSLTWTNHPQGTTTALACEWMSQRFSYIDDKTGERKWRNDFSAPIEWHIDGDGLEYIYCYTKTNVSPKTAITNNSTQDAFIPSSSASTGESGWLDEVDSAKTGWTSRKGVDAEYPYLWQASRKKAQGGNWGDFSIPVLRDHYGLDAIYLQLDKTNVGVPCNSDGKPKSGTAIVVTATLKYGSDVPQSMTVSGTGWSKSGWTATYTYTPSTSSVMNASSSTVTITVTKKNGTTETLSATVYFTPIVNGVGVNKIDNYYQLGISATSAPTGTWQKNTMLDPTAEKPYLWNYEMIYGDDGSLLVDGSGDKHVVGIYGKSISNITDYYCVVKKGVTPSKDDKTIGWTTDADSLSLPEGTHLMWNYEKIDYTDGTSYVVEPHPVGINIKGDTGTGIKSANVWYAITSSKTTAPNDNEFTYDTVSKADLASGKFLWECTIVIYDDASETKKYIGKICDGSCDDFATVEEQYAISTSNTTEPASGWATTYTATVGYWLWTRTKFTGKTSSVVWYSTARCIERFPEDGTSPVFVDIDNEMSSVACDKDGKTIAEVTLSTTASLWYGSTKQTLSTLTADALGSISASVNKSTGVVSYTIPKGTTIGAKNDLNINVSTDKYSGKAVFTIAGVRAGQNGGTGTNAVLYEISASDSAVSVNKSGTVTPSYVTAQIVKINGNSSTNLAGTSTDSNAVKLWYKKNGGTLTAYSSAISISSTDTSLRFELHKGTSSSGDLLDVETLPIVKDGNDGKTPVKGEDYNDGKAGADSVYLEIESGSFEGITTTDSKHESDGWFNVSGSPSVVIKGCKGGANENITSVTSAKIKYGNSSADVTKSLSGGKVTVTLSSVPRGQTYTAKENGSDKTYYIPVTTASIEVSAVVGGYTRTITIPVLVDFTAHFSNFYRNDSVFESNLEAVQSKNGELVSAQAGFSQRLDGVDSSMTDITNRVGDAEASLKMKVGYAEDGKTLESNAQLNADKIILSAEHKMQFDSKSLVINSDEFLLNDKGAMFSGDVKIGGTKQSDGSILNPKILLAHTGAGHIANKNIEWSEDGTLTLHIASDQFVVDGQSLLFKRLAEAFKFEIKENNVVAVYTDLDFYSTKSIAAKGKSQGSSGGDNSFTRIDESYINSLT